MRVVFLEDVPGVAQGGEIKEVKNGFARNYLIPKNLASPATHNAVQRVRKLENEAQVTRVKRLEDMRELAAEFDGAQISVEMRAGSSGRLYGSVTNAIIAERLAELTERDIDRRVVDLEEPIRDLGSYDLTIRLHPEVEASISVLVYPTGMTEEEFVAAMNAAEAAEEDEVEEEAAETDSETESEEEEEEQEQS